MKITGALLSLTAAASALVIHDIRDRDTNDTLVARNSYELGVNIFTNLNCAGSIVAVRNHDDASCAAATRHNGGYQFISARAKTDGTAHGNGCMSTFDGYNCDGAGYVYGLTGGTCINFNNNRGCIVVHNRNQAGGCTLTKPNC